MFIITVPDSGFKHYVYDIATGADIIVGLTNKDGEYDRAFSIMGNMRLGEMFFTDEYFIMCMPEEVGD